MTRPAVPPAELIVLMVQLVALAVPPNEQMNRFFKQRYGQAVANVLQPLSVALGRELGLDRDARKKRKRKLPTRRLDVDKPKPAPKKVEEKPEVKAIAAPAGEVEEAPAVTEDLPEFEHSEADDAFDEALSGDDDEDEEEEDSEDKSEDEGAAESTDGNKAADAAPAPAAPEASKSE